jgi:hypothetical protein
VYQASLLKEGPIMQSDVIPREVQVDQRPKPNFLIVGAAKAGTTSLYEYLKQHPDICLPLDPKRKEPTYFVDSYTGVRDYNDYLSLFAHGRGSKAIGEASTAYLYSEESPGWIKSVLGDIKIIILLRNPAKRAFSLYTWMVREGWENAKTFEDALAQEPVRLKDPNFHEHCLEFFPDYLYFGSGLYTHQVARYFTTFGKERVRVYLFEEFVKNPVATCQDVFDFLDVDRTFVPRIEVYNEGRVPFSIGLQFYMQSISMGQRAGYPVRLLLPKPYRGPVLGYVKWLNQRFGKKTTISPAAYQSLMARYLDDIRQLEQLLGRDLSIWYAKKGKN